MSPGGSTVVSVQPHGPPALSKEQCEGLRKEFYITSPTHDAYLQEKQDQKTGGKQLALDDARKKQKANHAVRESAAKKRLYSTSQETEGQTLAKKAADAARKQAARDDRRTHQTEEETQAEKAADAARMQAARDDRRAHQTEEETQAEKAADAARKQAACDDRRAQQTEEETQAEKAKRNTKDTARRSQKRAEGERRAYHYKHAQTELSEAERIQKKRGEMGTRYQQDRATRARDEALRRYRQRFPEKGKPPARAAWPPTAPQRTPTDAPSDAARLDTYVSLLDGGLTGRIHTCPNCKERDVCHGVPMEGEMKNGQVSLRLPPPVLCPLRPPLLICWCVAPHHRS